MGVYPSFRARLRPGTVFLRPVQPRELLMKVIDKWRGALYTHYVGRGAA